MYQSNRFLYKYQVSNPKEALLQNDFCYQPAKRRMNQDRLKLQHKNAVLKTIHFRIEREKRARQAFRLRCREEGRPLPRVVIK